MKEDYRVMFDDKIYECVDFGFKKNENVDIVIRPEDIDIVPRGQGILTGEVKSLLFKGVHYEIMVQTVSGTAKTVKMHVLANHDKVNPEAHEKISANDFTMDLEDVAEMTDADVIARANAQAWDEEDEFISLSTVDYDIKPQPGTYPATFGTSKGTSITIKISVVEPKYVEDNKHNIGITAFDFYKTPDEIKESVALNTDLKMWASAEAWDLEDDSPIEISEVKYDFDPETITEGDFDITFATKGRIFKIHTTDFQEEGKKVDLKFAPEDIHVMSKMGV